MQVIIQTRQRILIDKGIIASRPWARMRGLIGRSTLEPGEGLLLLGTIAIHTTGMHFAIDVAFVNKDGCILHMIHAMKPFHVSPLIVWSAMVIELPAGVLHQTGTQIGDFIQVTMTESTSHDVAHIQVPDEKAL